MEWPAYLFWGFEEFPHSGSQPQRAQTLQFLTRWPRQWCVLVRLPQSHNPVADQQFQPSPQPEQRPRRQYLRHSKQDLAAAHTPCVRLSRG